MTKTSFDGEFFKFSTFLVLLQSFGNCLVAAAVLFAQGGSKTRLSAGVPITDWLVAALGYFGAHKMGLAALAYISFPMQVICKSCKVRRESNRLAFAFAFAFAFALPCFALLCFAWKKYPWRHIVISYGA